MTFCSGTSSDLQQKKGLCLLGDAKGKTRTRFLWIQRLATCQLDRYAVRTCDEVEVCGELGRDLGDDVGREVARRQLGVLHQKVDGVRDLNQLAAGEICVNKR